MFRLDLQELAAPSSRPHSPTAANLDAIDIGWQALGPALAVTILSTTVVALRWYTRSRIVRCTGTDDYVILLSLALAWAMTAVVAAEEAEGIGDYRGPEHLTDLAKLIITGNALWAFTVTVTKASILMQYLRVFSTRLTRNMTYILLSLLLPSLCWSVLGGTLLCQPIAKLWNSALPGTCLSVQTYWTSTASIDIGLDLLVLLLPMPAIATLRLSRREKTALVLVFGLGFLVCGVSVARIVTVLATAAQGDYIVSGIWSIIWSSVEANVGIICASLLALKPLVARLWPRMMEDNRPPRHSMRLPMVQTRWFGGGSGEDVGEGSATSGKRTSMPHTSWYLHRQDWPLPDHGARTYSA